MYDCFLVTSDVIAITKKILKEYKGRAYPSIKILQSFLQDLQYQGKLNFLNQSLVDASVRRHAQTKTINYPSHRKDRKWIEVAIAFEARYIVSANGHLLQCAPNRLSRHLIESIEPSQYMEIRCPDSS